MNKYKCTCKMTWFSDDSLKDVQEEHSQDEGGGSGSHIVSVVKNLSPEDYAELWSMDLEDANRHSLTEMPTDILNILKKTVKYNKGIKKTMKLLYEEGIGV